MTAVLAWEAGILTAVWCLARLWQNSLAAAPRPDVQVIERPFLVGGGFTAFFITLYLNGV